MTLGAVPESEFLRWKQFGFTHIWLMGIWEVGLRSRVHSLAHVREQAVGLGCHESEIHGSTYSIAGYRVDERLGGEDGLLQFRERLHRHGLSLILDFIPNHIGLDHSWIRERPELLVHNHRKIPGTFREHTKAGIRFIAHGKDPYFPPWSDTAQVDYRNPEARLLMRQELLSIANRCDGVRCDMAMLMLNDVFEKTWSTFPTNHPAPQQEFWSEAIPAVRSAHPRFLFLAEAYWDLEPRLQQLGFDFVYLKTFYDHLIARRYRELTAFLERPVSFLEHGAFFLENHDEPRIAHLLSWPEHQAAALLLLSLPGLRLLHEGQLEGLSKRISVHLGRRPPDDPSHEVVRFYEKLLAFLPTTFVGKGRWRLLEADPEMSGGSVPSGVLFIQWQSAADAFDVVAVNLSAESAACRVQLPGAQNTLKGWICTSEFSVSSLQHVDWRLIGQSLFLIVQPHHGQVLRFRAA
ncbi:MAG: Alpha amylase catalytic region [Verrucomicrobiales bacterium]|nr:Alpha amylase catalytic region [Verrucomicrobiales bacterium]